MAKGLEDNNAFDAILTRLGLVLESRPSFNLWKIGEAGPAPLPSRQRRVQLPWRLKGFEVAEKKGALHIHRLALTLSREQLLNNLSIVTKKYFGPRTQAEFVAPENGPDQCVWCLFEFTRPGSREKAPEGQADAGHAAGELLPHGVAGFSFRLATVGAQAEIIVADYFGFGYIPGNFPSVPLRLIADALGLKGLAETLGAPLKSRSIYELTFSLADPALVVLTELLGKDSEHERVHLAGLRAALSVPRAPVNSAMLGSEAGWELRAPFEEVDRRALSAETAFVPLEVLESRERGERCRHIDQLIQAGKLGQARDLVRERLIGEPHGLDLMRRLSLVGLACKVDAGAELARRALRTEPANKLFLSFGINRALEDGDQATVLALLSRLGAELMGGIRGADALSCFDLVLPELLGDAWVAEDRRKAEECYHRIIQKRGDLPRILRKLIGLSRVGGRPETEISYLVRLSKVERRRVELAKIYFRLAELRCTYKTGQDEAIDLALKSLKCDRSHYRSALLAAELLVEQARPEEAIQLLDGLLRDPGLSLTGKARSRLEGMIGLIWLKKLGRIDLAEMRFESAAAHDQTNVEALRELEAIYRQNSNVKGLTGLLEQQFDAFEVAGDGESLRRVFDELVSLYRGMLGTPKRAYELYQRLLASNAMEPEEVERVLAWRDVEIDWRDLYLKLCTKLPGLPGGERRARFNCRLAEICRDRMQDATAATGHLLDALYDGWIDQASFTYLVERLTEARDYPLLVRTFDMRMERVDAEEKRRLILEFLALPEGLSDAKRDLLAVKAHELDPTDSRVVMQRLSFYQTGDDVDGIDRLLSLLVDDKSVSTYQRNHWLRAGIEFLTNCADEGRFEILDRLYRLLLASGEDAVAVLQDAIEALKSGRETHRLAFYVSKLLAAGYLPPLDEKTVTRLLAGTDRDLALYHQLMSFKSTQPEVAAQHARTAAAMYAARGGEDPNTERMLGRLSALVPCSEADLRQLAVLVETSGNYIVLARALHKQADFEDERTRKHALLEQLGQLYWKRLKDLNRARLTYGLVQRLSPHPWRVKLKLAQIAQDANDTPHERKALLEFLVDPMSTADIPAMKAAVRRLLAIGEEAHLLLRVLQPHAEQAYAAGSFELVLHVAEMLYDNGIASAEVYKTAFRAALALRLDEQVVDAWWRGLGCSLNKTKAKAYIAETRTLIENEGRPGLLLQCFQAALSNGIERSLGPKIRQELLILFGGLLFDTDSRRRKALGVFLEAYGADAEDNRTWMPLYFLLLEFGTPAERLRHLAEIIPRLDQDPRPLKSFPITIESLRAEFKELKATVVEPMSGAIGRRAYDDDDDDDLGVVANSPGARPQLPPLVGIVPPLPPVPPRAEVEPVDDPPLGAGVDTPEIVVGMRIDRALGKDPNGVNDRSPAISEGPSGFKDGAESDRAAADAEDAPAIPNIPLAAVTGAPPPSGVASLPRTPPLPRLAKSRHMALPSSASVPFETGGAAAVLSAASRVPALSLATIADAAQSADPGLESLVPDGTDAGMAFDLDAQQPGEPLSKDPAVAVNLGGGNASGGLSLDLSGDDAGSGLVLDLGSNSGTNPGHDNGAGGVSLDLGGSEDSAIAVGLGGAAIDSGPTWNLGSPGADFDFDAVSAEGAVKLGAAPSDGPSLDLGAPDAGLPAGGVLIPPVPGAGRLPAPGNSLAAILPRVAGPLTFGDDHPGGGLSGDARSPSGSFGFGDSPGTFELGGGPPVNGGHGRGGDLPLHVQLNAQTADTPADLEGDIAFDLGSAGTGDGRPLDLIGSDGDTGIGVVPGTFALTAPPVPDAVTLKPENASPAAGLSLDLDDGLPPLPDGASLSAGPVSLDASHAELPSLEAFGDGSAANEDVTVPHLPSHQSNAAMSGLSRQSSMSDSGNSSEGQDDVTDWRASVNKGDFNADLTGVLLRQAFASEIEKHLAIQTVSLVAGTCDKLSNWHWRVWRHAEEFGYPLNGKDRYPAGISPQILHSSLHKLLIAIAPLLVKLYKERFALDYVARRLEVSVAAVEKLRKPLPWDSGLLKEAGFGLYQQRIAERRYRAFNLPGLGKEIFYEGGTRCIYIDEAYYRKAPPSHLFHRVLGLLWSVRIHYFVPLGLHPQKQVVPVLSELHQTFGSQGFTRLRSRFTSRINLSKHMQGLDTRQIKSLYEKVGMPTEDMVQQLWDAMRVHVQRLLIAETLDVIGVFESILDRDLLKPGVLKHSQIYEMSPFAKGLIEFVTKLQI